MNRGAGHKALLLLALMGCGEKDVGGDDTAPSGICSGASAVIEVPEGELSGDVALSLVLSHPDSEAADVDIYYSVAGGAVQPITLVEGEGEGLASSPTGEAHPFIWDSLVDLGQSEVSDVTLVAQAFSSCGAWVRRELDGLTVTNVETIPPTCTGEVHTPEGIQEGTFAFAFSLFHDDGPAASVGVEYSTDGGANWNNFTQGYADCDGDGAEDVATGLETSAEGVEHCLTWLSERDIDADEDEVALRLSCTVEGEVQHEATSELFSVHNDPTPSAGELIITEMMIEPDARLGAYMEFYNRSGHTLNAHGADLKIWYSDSDIDSEAPRSVYSIWVDNGSVPVAPGGYLVVAIEDSLSLNGCVDADVETGTDFQFTDDRILALEVGGEHVTVLSFASDDGWDIPRSASVSLDPAYLDSEDWDSVDHWCEATSAIEACDEYPSQSDLGTPGAVNDSCP